nr:MAG TPA: hypothetical protein [Crassvirales sp.]
MVTHQYLDDDVLFFIFFIVKNRSFEQMPM